MDAGIPVLCEKPLTLTLDEAVDLAKAVKKAKVPFVVAYSYTAFQMVMLAREMVQRRRRPGAEGGSLVSRRVASQQLEAEGQQQASWRVDPSRSGASGLRRGHRDARSTSSCASSPDDGKAVQAR